MNDFYSDEELTELFGKRYTGGISIFEPNELGWICPADKRHWLQWSEFNKHIWCEFCGKDYFSLLCPKEMNRHTTPEILKREVENLKEEMSKWTLSKYKGLKNDL